MSYRNHLSIVNRKKLAKVKKMNAEQLWELTGGNPEDFDLDEEDDIIHPPYYRDVIEAIGGEELLEVSEAIFYKDSNFKLKPYLKRIFKNPDIQEWYNEDTEFMIAKPEILDGLIDFYISKTRKYYNTLLLKDSDNPKNDFGEPLNPQLERLQKHVETQLSWMNFINDSQSKWCLSTSWLYEYDVFNLIHIKKMFDPKKQVLIWTGS